MELLLKLPTLSQHSHSAWFAAGYSDDVNSRVLPRLLSRSHHGGARHHTATCVMPSCTRCSFWERNPEMAGVSTRCIMPTEECTCA